MAQSHFLKMEVKFTSRGGGGGGGVLERTAEATPTDATPSPQTGPFPPSFHPSRPAGCNSGPPPPPPPLRDSPPLPPSRAPLSRGRQRGRRGMGKNRGERKEGGRERGEGTSSWNFERRRVRGIISTRHNHSVNDVRKEARASLEGRGRAQVGRIQPGFP